MEPYCLLVLLKRRATSTIVESTDILDINLQKDYVDVRDPDQSRYCIDRFLGYIVSFKSWRRGFFLDTFPGNSGDIIDQSIGSNEASFVFEM